MRNTCGFRFGGAVNQKLSDPQFVDRLIRAAILGTGGAATGALLGGKQKKRTALLGGLAGGTLGFQNTRSHGAALAGTLAGGLGGGILGSTSGYGLGALIDKIYGNKPGLSQKVIKRDENNKTSLATRSAIAQIAGNSMPRMVVF